MITCPGGDFCSLANAKSIPIATALEARFADLDHLYDIGELELNISGCMNSCGHHHLGAIGILGVDKHGEEWYQVTLGGAQGNATRIGEVIGRAFAAAEVPDAVERIVETYLAQRLDGESFQEAVLRLGLAPFREAAYRKPTNAAGGAAAEGKGEPAHV
jgi:sulfite reductase (NADPH) hemoprotein beta-component